MLDHEMQFISPSQAPLIWSGHEIIIQHPDRILVHHIHCIRDPINHIIRRWLRRLRLHLRNPDCVIRRLGGAENDVLEIAVGVNVIHHFAVVIEGDFQTLSYAVVGVRIAASSSC